ncbi:MAG: beta-galactosidase [bacterium]
MKVGLILILLVLNALYAWASPTSIDKDGMLVVNGDRCFILGLYQQAGDDDFASEVAQAGFNLICAGQSVEALDRAQAHGLQCWIPLGGIAVSSDAQEKKLQSVVDSFKSHPALAVWEGPDETLWNVWWSRWNRAVKRWDEVEKAVGEYKKSHSDSESLDTMFRAWRRYKESARYELSEEVEGKIRQIVGLPQADERISEWRTFLDPLFDGLKRGTGLVRRTDPDHVIWFNHAPRNTMEDLTRFGTVADIVGCDIYPVPFGPKTGHSDLAERNLASVGRFTERMAQSAPGKPAWMVLQGFGWNDLSEERSSPDRPSYNETRYMAYNAIIHGARGILYWGTAYIERDSELWTDIKKVVSELRDLQPLLASPDATNRVKLNMHPTSGSGELEIVLLAKERDGEWMFIVENESGQAREFDISGLESLNGRKVEVLNEDETIEVKNGRLAYGLRGQGVSVLITKP